MKCPKYKAAYIASGFAQPNVDIECDREECAWWDDGQPGCAVLTIAQELATKRQQEEVEQ